MGLLSDHEEIVWREFQHGYSTSQIAQRNDDVGRGGPAYVSRVLNRAREKIARILKSHAESHRLDIETLLDYKGLVIGFDYQANAQVFIIFTLELGVIVWYKHDSYAGKLCPECPKEEECRKTLDTIIEEYAIVLRPDKEALPMTQQSIAIFNKLAAKEIPRYKRKTGSM